MTSSSENPDGGDVVGVGVSAVGVGSAGVLDGLDGVLDGLALGLGEPMLAGLSSLQPARASSTAVAATVERVRCTLATVAARMSGLLTSPYGASDVSNS
ncbi:hypothetical protein C7S10_19805 [Nocardioides currus]|uniref:Uncharacterized protein n=1 Tax=Nocardioides currus TaxID=2133958 RepID=A0A2R7YT97_9ACTN|nr:hypothetical protein C7S10_19805 [Nocardioides currus]